MKASALIIFIINTFFHPFTSNEQELINFYPGSIPDTKATTINRAGWNLYSFG